MRVYVRSTTGDEENHPHTSRDTGPGWDLEVQGGLRVVEGNPDRASVVENTEYDGKGPSNDWNERVVDTNALR